MSRGRIRIGISGWRYPPWRGVFYPDKLVQRKELAFASRALSAIEINGSFYSLQTPQSYGNWFDETPDDFAFTLKAPQYITHIKRLKNVEAPVANFFASGVLRLGAKLGAVLWQLPPSLKFDPAVLEPFLAGLPTDFAQALELARRHDAKLSADEAWLRIDADRPLRHALEVRHASFANDDVVRLLRQYNVAQVIADTGGRWPENQDVTADFVYLRLHGASELYESGYDEAAIEDWARRIRLWSEGRQPDDAPRVSDTAPPKRTSRDVFCHFDNTMKEHAPENAARLSALLGVPHGMDAQGRFHAEV